MTRAIGLEQIIAQKVLSLSKEQQQQVLDFIEFLQLKSLTVEFKHHDGTPMSALEAAGDLVGCVDSGPGDLSTNKEYLKRPLTE
ncbi:hypothetical protein [Nostoc sp. 'Peltigera membranacea cyanobiont' N6]|uniref:hypothetical protein n=1 Tax=Nostoc sp. 'Peltigera membranacea cyanobiont' N6 TaxID=1261031 RepID=UPI000D0C429E|nr:hypothetical protein [Nostoc sp. 'Peltigera membranacea cyanobiont' N6]AVH62683.1 hypothetical protein NPM_0825 [Nostoc sp. 'Peltigera membranacea cyanobiont' N6]